MSVCASLFILSTDSGSPKSYWKENEWVTGLDKGIRGPLISSNCRAEKSIQWAFPRWEIGVCVESWKKHVDFCQHSQNTYAMRHKITDKKTYEVNFNSCLPNGWVVLPLNHLNDMVSHGSTLLYKIDVELLRVIAKNIVGLCEFLSCDQDIVSSRLIILGEISCQQSLRPPKNFWSEFLSSLATL